MRAGLVLFATLLHLKLCDSSFVDPNYVISQWDGWSFRIGHWANVVGSFDENVVFRIAESLFSPKGLNLNIVRHAIGATTPGDNSCGAFDPGSNYDSFQDGLNSPLLETRGLDAQKILLAVKMHGVDSFEAMSFSPPSWMTRTNCSKGNADGTPLHDNFDPKYANAFANYITEVVKHYRDNLNISFSYLCPFYEPSSGTWIGSGKGREGCNMERSTIAEVIISTYTSLQAKNLTYCSISASGENTVLNELTTQKYFIVNGLDYLYSKVGSMLDGNEYSQLAELSTITNRNGKKLEQNNYYGSGSSDMQAGILLATTVVENIRRLAVSSWGIGDAPLIDIPFADPKFENVIYTQNYYCLQQFSKHITKGYTFIQITDCDTQCVAAYSSEESTLVIVVVNADEETQQKSFDLTAFSNLGNITMFRTSLLEPHVPVAAPHIVQGQLNLEFPRESVSTIQVLRAVAYERTNLIINGDFESTSQIPVAWYLLYGDRADHGINGNYVYRGNKSGNLDLTSSSLTLMQNTTAATPRIHHLSAWCSATGPGVWLGISINGQFRTEVEIQPNIGYMLYGWTSG